jgi:hypothetical protein
MFICYKEEGRVSIKFYTLKKARSPVIRNKCGSFITLLVEIRKCPSNIP